MGYGNYSDVYSKRVEETAEGIRFNVIWSKTQQPNSLRSDVHVAMLSLSSENTQRDDGFRRHFLFNPRWGNKIYYNTHQHSKDLFFKHTSSLLPPVANPTRSVNSKESPFSVTKSCTLI
ncbi:hypothetical protein Q7C36_023219 [Tachysurus vachellii]|uniref:Uncharacterized protein n=1 Tax=Tachysurus vachellii TaxID=175792 RepID=A0AA88IJG9_TACVA|nr:hypothetical protein Q7C36_023219 [Tachysurus vachellii]